MRILIIEDDTDTQDYIQKRLIEKCFAVDVASNGEVGMRSIRDNHYDVILVDYALPYKNGMSIIQEVRCLDNPIKKHTPIIMISVTHEVDHKINALEFGADDYLAKPFFFDELYARIQTILRRPRIRESSLISLGTITLDINRQQVLRNGTPLALTRKEFSLLEYLMHHQGSIVSRNAISEHVWDTQLSPFSNTIETHILNLRKKIGSEHPEQIIQSIPGRGYKIGT